jgi:hypothetical protein
MALYPNGSGVARPNDILILVELTASRLQSSASVATTMHAAQAQYDAEKRQRRREEQEERRHQQQEREEENGGREQRTIDGTGAPAESGGDDDVTTPLTPAVDELDVTSADDEESAAAAAAITAAEEEASTTLLLHGVPSLSHSLVPPNYNKYEYHVVLLPHPGLYPALAPYLSLALLKSALRK